MTRSLAQFPLFRELDPDQLKTIESACAWRRVAAREWIVDHEAQGTDVFLVLRGQLRVVVSAGGRDTILRDIMAGEFFGELAALDLKPRSAGIMAIADSELACLPAAAFRRAIHAHPVVCDRVLGLLVSQIRMLANRASESSGLKMRHRLLAELLRLSRPAAAAPDSPVVSPPPTHAELAARVSSHREAVTRELNSLTRAGLIARRRGAIVLLDATRLRRMVSEATEG